ncbi:MAG: hypothetical protein U0163_13895 [Gemmatimonadaceae bacterium]
MSRFFRHPELLGLLLLPLFLASTPARAQDTFEVQVYEYETVPRGMWNLETHFNYTMRGSTAYEGSVAPTNHQAHLTFELTRGITDHFELAGYLVFAHRPGAGAEYVAYRIRPRVSVPEAWGWPVKVSLSTEVGFPKSTYEAAHSTLEIRPIVEKGFGKFTVDVNPTLGRALSGPGSDEGWDMEPGARVGYAVSPKVDLSLEYYGSLGSVTDPLPADQATHLLFPGADISLGDGRVLNVGIGGNLTDAGIQSMVKLRLGWLFGGSGK